eukprot:CAMPEP_0116547458 /NCGR_PEP_ID=MMETSP0397-20121206/3792_1 /TAXON_ID=216820 /ORGANISM="Cyclophora tenuis, Strain ECT3854" /LENGTH=107 /DNA_ID=CAMNT_0004071999 /DNA_START=389 /DNA_END=713 /DNA_ORIENTATION=-
MAYRHLASNARLAWCAILPAKLMGLHIVRTFSFDEIRNVVPPEVMGIERLASGNLMSAGHIHGHSSIAPISFGRDSSRQGFVDDTIDAMGPKCIGPDLSCIRVEAQP